MFTDSNGFVTFKAGATNGQGGSIYTLATDGKGLGGLYEQLPDGTSKLIGGDYGFAGQAVQMLINAGQRTQAQVQLVAQQTQAKLQLAQQQAQQAFKVQQAQAMAKAAPPSQSTRLQQAASPQAPTFAPQLPTYNPQASTYNPQSTVSGPSLNQSGTGGIKLGSSSGPSIRL
jgi:type II secretory pathway pseudopilin PulG